MPKHGKGGRPPIPTQLRVLRGNPGKRPLPANEPKPEPGLPPCPGHFTEAQKKAFTDFGEQLLAVGVLTKLDGAALQLLALCYDRTMQSAEDVSKRGPAWINASGCVVDGQVVALPETEINPHWKIQLEAMKRLQSLLVEFGMTPSSRVKVQTIKPTEDKPKDGKRRFFAG